MSDESPRILLVSPTGLVSGAEVVLVRLAEAATGAGWSVSGACPTGPLSGALSAAGARVHEIADLKLPTGPRALATARLVAPTISAAGRVRALASDCDVVLVNGLFALPAARLARLSAPVAWLVHDVLRRRSWETIERIGRRGVDCAIAVSEVVAVPLRRRGLRVEVVRNGTPWPVEGIGDEPPSEPVVGCAALLTPWKGQHVLLEAASRLEPRVKVELVGGRFPKDARYVESLLIRASRPDLEGRVEFLGHLEEPLERMRTWSVGVSASVEPEAGPLFPLEAMSVGLPVVGTDHGGTPEVLGGAGLLVPPGDPVAMAEAVSRLLEDDDLWLRCHEEGPRQVAQNLTLERQLRELLGVLGALAGFSR